MITSGESVSTYWIIWDTSDLFKRKGIKDQEGDKFELVFGSKLLVFSSSAENF